MSEEKPIHISVEDKNDIANIVIMPGDPLRAKYIAENFLQNYKLVTSVRNMLGYTGFFHGRRVTVMGSGMGMPSMSIYAYELFHFFNVEKIIRIGTCGAVNPKIEINDMILASCVYSESNFAWTYNNFPDHVVVANRELNNDIISTAEEMDYKDLHVGMLTTMDAFGPYIDGERVLNRIPDKYEILGEEMEAFALIHIANSMHRKATAIATVTDSKFSDKVLSIEERQTSLNNMIILALEAIIK